MIFNNLRVIEILQNALDRATAIDDAGQKLDINSWEELSEFIQDTWYD